MRNRNPKLFWAGMILLIALAFVWNHSTRPKHAGKDIEEWFQLFAADWSSYSSLHQVPLTPNQTNAVLAYRALGDGGIDYLIQLGFQEYKPTQFHKLVEDFLESLPRNTRGMIERNAYHKKYSALALLEHVGLDFHQAKKKTNAYLTSNDPDQIVFGLILQAYTTNEFELLVEQYRPFILHPKSSIRYVTQQGLKKCGLYATNAIPELLQLSPARVTKDGYAVLANIGQNSTEVSNRIVTLTKNKDARQSLIALLALCTMDQNETNQTSQRLMKLIREELAIPPSKGIRWPGMLGRLSQWPHPLPTLHPLLLELPDEYFQTTVHIAYYLNKHHADISPLLAHLRKVLESDERIFEYRASHEMALLLLLKSDPYEPAVWNFLDQKLQNSSHVEIIDPFAALIQVMARFNPNAKLLFDKHPTAQKEFTEHRISYTKTQLRAHHLLPKKSSASFAPLREK
jgi:hypothetical protein